jgi:hypothetical protein
VNLPDKLLAAEFEDGKRAIASEMVTGQFLREIGEALKGTARFRLKETEARPQARAQIVLP